MIRRLRYGPHAARRGKFNNRKTVVEGITFDSAKEAARFVELKLLLKAGDIHTLRRQFPYPLNVRIPEFQSSGIGSYVADFDYFRGEEHITEDVKGFKTPLYKWKKKHFEAQYGRKILET